MNHTTTHTTYAHPGRFVDPDQNMLPPRIRRDLPEPRKSDIPRLDPLAAMIRCESPEQAAMALANQLPPELTGTRMAVGMLDRRGMCILRAVTGLTRLDRRTEQARAMEAALDEAVIHGDSAVFQRDRQAELPLKTHAHLASLLDCRWVVSGPLRDSTGLPVGAWLLWGKSDEQQQAAMAWLPAAGQSVASVLQTLTRANEGLLTRATRSLRQRLDTRRKRWLVGAVALAVVFLAALPLRYRIHCDCTIEPVVRRYVAAPFAATLSRTLVEPGDLVQAGDLLAKLDGREIRWELAALEADYQQAQKGRDTAMAKRKTATTQLARLEMKQLEQRIALMHDRQQHLEIRSPLEGMVVSGDLQRVEGAPLTIGQSLFEIAPLEQVIVEVAIAESEIAYVGREDTVAIRIDAFPGQPWTGRVNKIHPKSELRDSRQVFIAEVNLANTDGLLRPGMRGRANLHGPRAALGWILFHKPWEAATRWLGW